VAGQVVLAEHERRHRGAGNQLRPRRRIAPRRRNRVEHFAARHERRLVLDDVDDGGFGGDGEHFFEGTDLQLGIHRRGEVAFELDVAAPDGLEAVQRERHLIDARAEVDDLVLAVAVGDGSAGLLNQHRARRFDQDTGHHGARRVLDDSADGGAVLGGTGSRDEEHRGAKQRATQYDSTHVSLPL
jgi:hypothetical protein